MRLKLGLDSYSFHRYFGETTKWETLPEEQWTLGDFLRLLDELKVPLASLQTKYLPELPVVRAELNRWLDQGSRDVVLTWGHPFGFDGGRNLDAFTDVIRYLTLCAEIGATQLRIVLGNSIHFSESIADRKRILIPQLQELACIAREKQILLSIENHADFRVMELVALIEEVGEAGLGLCFDVGNALRVGDPPQPLLRQLDLSRVFMIQLKEVRRIVGHEAPTGWWPTVEYGTGDVGADECLNILQERNYPFPVVIEISNVFTGLTELEIVKKAVQRYRPLFE